MPPIKFTHSPLITAPSRGTPPIVHQELINPKSGRKHMLVKFWVHGRGKDEPEPFGMAKDAFRTVKAKAIEYGLIFPTRRKLEDDSMEVEEEVEAKEAGKSWSDWLGLGGLTSFKSADRERRRVTITRKPPPAGTYKMGEVTADWVKVPSIRQSQ